MANIENEESISVLPFITGLQTAIFANINLKYGN